MPEKAELEKILEQVRWIQHNIELVRWNPKDYARLFGQRKLKDILESRQASYMNPCFDLTAALALRLKEAGFKSPMLVVQELLGEHTGKPVFHFALEVPVSGKTFTVDFRTMKTVLVYGGGFSPKKSNPSLKNLSIRRFSTRRLSGSQTMLGFLGARSWRELGTKFRFCNAASMRAAVLAMKRADSQTLFEKVRKMPFRIRRI